MAASRVEVLPGHAGRETHLAQTGEHASDIQSESVNGPDLANTSGSAALPSSDVASDASDSAEARVDSVEQESDDNSSKEAETKTSDIGNGAATEETAETNADPTEAAEPKETRPSQPTINDFFKKSPATPKLKIKLLKKEEKPVLAKIMKKDDKASASSKPVEITLLKSKPESLRPRAKRTPQRLTPLAPKKSADGDGLANPDQSIKSEEDAEEMDVDDDDDDSLCQGSGAQTPVKSEGSSIPEKIDGRKKRARGAVPIIAKYLEDPPWVDDFGQNSPYKQPQEAEYTLENHPDVAFLVEFKQKFEKTFVGTPDMGPTDLEDGLVEENMNPIVDAFMCRLLELVLNRKRPIEVGKFRGALDELHSHLKTLGVPSDWPHVKLKAKDAVTGWDWPVRLIFFKTLAWWAMQVNEPLRQYINDARDAETVSGRKLKPKENDIEKDIPSVEVSPIGSDSEGYAYYAVSNKAGSQLRLYRESNTHLRIVRWECVATNEEELEEMRQEFIGRNDPLDTAMASTVKVLQLELHAANEKVTKEKEREALVELAKSRQVAANKKLREELATEGSDARSRTRGKRVNYQLYDDNNNSGGGKRSFEDYEDSEDEFVDSPKKGNGYRKQQVETRKSARLMADEGSTEDSDGVETNGHLPSFMVTLKYQKPISS